MGITRNEINFLLGKMKNGTDGGSNVFPPFLGGFSVIEPRSGEKLNFEINGILVSFFDF
jgi:hypothetical protein